MRRNWLISLLLGAALLGLVGGVRTGALWASEVEVAELSRRIGLNLLGGEQLRIPGADNTVPIRADLGRGELPFTSAALGFRCFGLNEWAGRLPLAIWGLIGLAAIYAALARLWDQRAALYAVLALATTPLYFLHARTLLGDAVTLGSFAVAWSGLSVALLAAEQSGRARAAFGVLGVLGLYAGFWCRGPIVSVAVPAGSVAFAALVAGPLPGRFGRVAALAVAALAVAALCAGLWALARQREVQGYSVLVAGTVSDPGQLLRFDTPFTALLHACFPWSAAAPLAVWLPWRAERSGHVSRRYVVAAAAALALAASLAAEAWLSTWLGPAVSPGAVCLAVLVAGALRELEQRPAAYPLLALSIAALALMLGLDLRTYADKTLAGFGLAGVSLPESLSGDAAALWTWGGVVVALGSVWCLSEAQVESEPAPAFRRADYADLLGRLQGVWDGNLVFAFLVLEAGLVGFLLLGAISDRMVPLAPIQSFGSFPRTLVAVAAIVVPLLPLLPLAALASRDLARVVFAGRWRARFPLSAPTRAEGLLLILACVGLGASLGFFPELARQLAPKELFARYEELRRPGEPLSTLGEQGPASRYQGARIAERFSQPDAAFRWLSGAKAAGSRRWLLLSRPNLAPLNALFRERGLGNLPVLDARSSEVLLAASRRRPAEREQNPLSDLVLDAAPRPQRPLHAVLGARQLQLLGYDVVSLSGELVSSITPGARYALVVYYRVLSRITGDWQSFVHIDGLQRRFNADHPLLDGQYPPVFWRRDDIIVDRAEVELDPNFSRGTYRVFFGLYNDSGRLPVVEGPARDDRIDAGELRVR